MSMFYEAQLFNVFKDNHSSVSRALKHVKRISEHKRNKSNFCALVSTALAEIHTFVVKRVKYYDLIPDWMCTRIKEVAQKDWSSNECLFSRLSSWEKWCCKHCDAEGNIRPFTVHTDLVELEKVLASYGYHAKLAPRFYRRQIFQKENDVEVCEHEVDIHGKVIHSESKNEEEDTNSSSPSDTESADMEEDDSDLNESDESIDSSLEEDTDDSSASDTDSSDIEENESDPKALNDETPVSLSPSSQSHKRPRLE